MAALEQEGTGGGGKRKSMPPDVFHHSPNQVHCFNQGNEVTVLRTDWFFILFLAPHPPFFVCVCVCISLLRFCFFFACFVWSLHLLFWMSCFCFFLGKERWLSFCSSSLAKGDVIFAPSLGTLLGDLGQEVRPLALLDVCARRDSRCTLVMGLGVLQIMGLRDLIELRLAVDFLHVNVGCCCCWE